MWGLNLSTAQYNQFKMFLILAEYIPPSSYTRYFSTFPPPDDGVKLSINYDTNIDTEDHLPYKTYIFAIMYSNNYVKIVSQEYHILDPLFSGTEPI